MTVVVPMTMLMLRACLANSALGSMRWSRKVECIYENICHPSCAALFCHQLSLLSETEYKRTVLIRSQHSSSLSEMQSLTILSPALSRDKCRARWTSVTSARFFDCLLWSSASQMTCFFWRTWFVFLNELDSDCIRHAALGLISQAIFTITSRTNGSGRKAPCQVWPFSGSLTTRAWNYFQDLLETHETCQIYFQEW